MRTSYRPELDTYPELTGKDASYCMSLIGILRWIVELGRSDICLECSMMSSCLALPRVGHLEQVMHIFGYLKQHHNAELVFDPTYPEIDEDAFQKKDGLLVNLVTWKPRRFYRQICQTLVGKLL